MSPALCEIHAGRRRAICLMADKGWLSKFDDPIEAQDGIGLNTLREAIAYLAKTVPKSERDMSAGTTAAGCCDETSKPKLATVSLMRPPDRMRGQYRTPGRTAVRAEVSPVTLS